MNSYAQALENWKAQQGLTQRQQALKAQIKGMQPGAQRKAARQELQGIKKQLKSMPSAVDLQRQMYMGATTPSSELYDIRTTAPASGLAQPPDGTLAAIRGLMDGASGTPDFTHIYGMGGGGL